MQSFELTKFEIKRCWAGGKKQQQQQQQKQFNKQFWIIDNWSKNIEKNESNVFIDTIFFSYLLSFFKCIFEYIVNPHIIIFKLKCSQPHQDRLYPNLFLMHGHLDWFKPPEDFSTATYTYSLLVGGKRGIGCSVPILVSFDSFVSYCYLLKKAKLHLYLAMS